MLWDASKATSSDGLNPASAMRASIESTLSVDDNVETMKRRVQKGLPVGSGTVLSTAGPAGGGRPNIYWSLGAPGQFAVPIAAARWTLDKRCEVIPVKVVLNLFYSQIAGTQSSGLEDWPLISSNVVNSCGERVTLEIGLNIDGVIYTPR